MIAFLCVLLGCFGHFLVVLCSLGVVLRFVDAGPSVYVLVNVWSWPWGILLLVLVGVVVLVFIVVVWCVVVCV